MAMSDLWTDRLSEYLDGELSAGEQAELETHLRGCAECAALLVELRRVVARARAVEDRPPTRDLWPGIAQHIGVARGPRRFTFSLPQLAAAGIALAALAGGGAWLAHPVATTSVAMPAAPEQLPAVTAAARSRSAQSYDAAVADLERVLRAGRGRLDTATVRVIEQNLAAIDRAILEAQRAVAADSANLYLNSHLAATMRRKLELLRQAAALLTIES
jgi:Putative zinc-finger